MAVEVVHVRPDLEPVRGGQRGGVDPRAGDDDHPQPRHEAPGLGQACDHASQEVLADARSADGDHANLLVGLVTQLPAQCAAGGERGRVEPGYVAGETEVRLGPFSDRGQPGPKVPGHDVVGLADEDRTVAHSRVPRYVLEHLGVVVGGEGRLALAAFGHRQPADEVGQPNERGGLALGVLVQEVVDFPRLVADPEVVLLLAHHVVEDHEVRKQDLVHAPQRLEHVQLVAGRLGPDVRALAGQGCARRMDPLAVRLEHLGDRVLGEPVDLEIRTDPAELGGDRDVTARVSETDRR